MYIFVNTDKNRRIFNFNLVLHDNGVTSIGSFIYLIDSYKIERNMQGIPFIFTNHPTVALIPQKQLLTVPPIKIFKEINNLQLFRIRSI